MQVTDTPGLLYRADEERNAMELLTVATLEHLPTAALFVMDLTEECGCSCQQQWEIRTELLSRFPHKSWIDVITKLDLLEEEIDAADELGQSEPHRDRVPEHAVQMVQAPLHTSTQCSPSYSSCVAPHILKSLMYPDAADSMATALYQSVIG